MRDVLSSQPHGRLAHGFLLFCTDMQLWVSRLGAYTSDTFDFLEQSERFIYGMAGYER
jgi:hypothetical protein